MSDPLPLRQGICVFCGSRSGSDPRYVDAASKLGTLLAEERFDLIYGGSADGCMGAIADAALSKGGRVIGVAPRFLGSLETRHGGLTRLDTVQDLATRKLRMLSLSVGVIVLPGGTGTLDELLEVLTMKRLTLVSHPVVVVNVAGFFRPFTTLLDHLISSGFAGPEQKSLYQLVDDPASAIRVLHTLLGWGGEEPRSPRKSDDRNGESS